MTHEQVIMCPTFIDWIIRHITNDYSLTNATHCFICNLHSSKSKFPSPFASPKAMAPLMSASFSFFRFIFSSILNAPCLTHDTIWYTWHYVQCTWPCHHDTWHNMVHMALRTTNMTQHGTQDAILTAANYCHFRSVLMRILRCLLLRSM